MPVAEISTTAEENLGVGAGRVIYQGFRPEVWYKWSPPGFRNIPSAITVQV